MDSRTLQQILLALCIIVATIWSANQLFTPPEPIAATAATTEFSAQRAARHLWQTHNRPHPLGSTAHDSVVSYLVNTLQSYGLQPLIQKTTGFIADSSGYFPLNLLWAANIENIVAKIPGTNSQGTILLCAHYDSMPTTIGASDGGTGTASLLELARALKQSPPLQNDIVLFFSDADVNGCMGAESFRAVHPLAQQYDVVIKMEGMGTSGSVMLIYSGNYNYRLVKDFVKAAPYPQPILFANDFLNSLQMASSPDVAVLLRNKQAAGLGFGYATHPEVYHTMLDHPKNVNIGVMQQYGENVLGFVQYIGNKPLKPYYEPQANAVSFSLGRKTAIVYSSSWTIPLAAFTTLLLLTLCVVALRKEIIIPNQVFKGMMRFLLFLAGSTGINSLVMLAIKKLNPNYQVFLQGIYGFEWYLPAMILLTLALLYLLFSKTLVKQHTNSAWIGIATFWLLFMWLTAVYSPAASYFFTIPLLLALFTTGFIRLMPMTESNTWVPTILLAMLATLTLAICYPAIYFMYAFSARYYALTDVPMVFMAVFLIAMTAGLLLPVWHELFAHRNSLKQKWYTPAFVMSAMVFITIGLFNSRFSEKHPYPNFVAYDYDADANQAYWFSLGNRKDDYTKYFLGENPTEAAYEILPGYIPGKLYTGYTKPAPVIPLPMPEVNVMKDTVMNERRQLTLHIASQRKANALRIAVTAEGLGKQFMVNDSTLSKREMPDSLANTVRLIFYNPQPGITIKVSTPVGKKVNVFVEEYSNGLPAIPGKNIIKRTAAMMPGLTEFTDPTVVRKSFSF